MSRIAPFSVITDINHLPLDWLNTWLCHSTMETPLTEVSFTCNATSEAIILLETPLTEVSFTCNTNSEAITLLETSLTEVSFTCNATSEAIILLETPLTEVSFTCNATSESIILLETPLTSLAHVMQPVRLSFCSTSNKSHSSHCLLS